MDTNETTPTDSITYRDPAYHAGCIASFEPRVSTDYIEPITHVEALSAVGMITDACAEISLKLRIISDGDAPFNPASSARKLRGWADMFDEFRQADHPGDILRRAADQIDPPAAPAAPDLTTVQGWIDAAEDAAGWSGMPTAADSEQLAAMGDAWALKAGLDVGAKLAANYVDSTRCLAAEARL